MRYYLKAHAAKLVYAASAATFVLVLVKVLSAVAGIAKLAS